MSAHRVDQQVPASELTRRARYVAGRAVAETRIGLPYIRASIAPGAPSIEAPEAIQTCSGPREAESMLLRLHAGMAALLLLDPSAVDSARQLAADDLRRASATRQALQSMQPDLDESDPTWLERARTLLSSAANLDALTLVASELQKHGSLSMEEVDFLVEHADGDPEALDGLRRYRELFAEQPVPWPDHT